MMKKGICLLTALMVLGSAGAAWSLGLGVGYRLPVGDFSDLYDGGFGANVVMEFPLAPTISAYGDVGYTRFVGKDLGSLLGVPLGSDDVDVWGFSAGAKFGIGGLYLGGEVGYFTEIDETGLSPLVGMGFGPLDLSARYKITGDANWLDLRLAISFGP